jgi:hypothetical protein
VLAAHLLWCELTLVDDCCAGQAAEVDLVRSEADLGQLKLDELAQNEKLQARQITAGRMTQQNSTRPL